MVTSTYDAQGLMSVLVKRGWVRSEADPHLLTHPDDYALGLRYDPETKRMTVSPELDAYLDRIIISPPSRSHSRH